MRMRNEHKTSYHYTYTSFFYPSRPPPRSNADSPETSTYLIHYSNQPKSSLNSLVTASMSSRKYLSINLGISVLS